MVGNLLAQTGCRFGSPGKDTDAADRTVQSMDKSQIDFTGFVVFLFDVGLGHRQKIFVFGRIGLHGHIDRLFDHQQVVVFKDDFHLYHLVVWPHGRT